MGDFLHSYVRSFGGDSRCVCVCVCVGGNGTPATAAAGGSDPLPSSTPSGLDDIRGEFSRMTADAAKTLNAVLTHVEETTQNNKEPYNEP